MRKISFKKIALAGLVGVMVSSSAYGAPVHNNDFGDPNVPDVVYSLNSSHATTSVETANTAQAVNAQKGANFQINQGYNNPFLACNTPLVDTLPAQAFQQIIAAVQQLFFVQLTETIQGPTGPQQVSIDSDLVRLTSYCTGLTGVTQLEGGGELFRWVSFYMSGQWPGQTPGICYTRNLTDILPRLQEYHKSGLIQVPLAVKTLFNLAQNDPTLGTMSCMEKFCTTIESPQENAYCPATGFLY